MRTHAGARALGAPLVAVIVGAAEELDQAAVRYLVGFFCRLGMIIPSVAMHLACRTARRRLAVLRAPK